MIAVGIITAPRGRATLNRSLASYHAAGFAYLTRVFAEPGSAEITPLPANIRVHQNKTRLGNLRNWVNALRVLTTTTDDPWLMVCEDDIQWAPGASTILEYDLVRFNELHEKWSVTGVISLYCPIRMSKVLEQEHANGKPLMYGWYGARIGRKTWGAQCLVFHRNWALKLLADPRLLEYLGDASWDKNVDAIVAETINHRGSEIMYRIPCLVDHTYGDGNSSLGYKDDRPELKTKYFEAVA